MAHRRETIATGLGPCLRATILLLLSVGVSAVIVICFDF